MQNPIILVDNALVYTSTGEILNCEQKPSALSEPLNYQIPLSDCRSADDLELHLKDVDLRKLPLRKSHNLRDLQDYAHGVWRRTGVDCRITVPMMHTLQKLHGLVQYRNIIIMTQADLAKALGTAASNLMKKLSTLISSNMVKVSTSRSGNIRSGEIKLTIHPALIFRGDDRTRQSYIDHWYLDLMATHPKSASYMNKIALEYETILPQALAA